MVAHVVLPVLEEHLRKSGFEGVADLVDSELEGDFVELEVLDLLEVLELLDLLCLSLFLYFHMFSFVD